MYLHLIMLNIYVIDNNDLKLLSNYITFYIFQKSSLIFYISRIPPSNQPFQKGRYWNYEEERWSFCNSDDDEERKEEIKEMEQTIKKATNTEILTDGEQNKMFGEKEEDKIKEEDGEWEYYYEDVEEKKNNANDKDKGKLDLIDKVKGAEKDKKLIPLNEPGPEPVNPERVAEKVLDKEEKNIGWECPVCTLQNPLERPGCLACTTERPAQLGAAAPVPAAPATIPVAATVSGQAAAGVKKDGGLDAYKQLENLDIIPNSETFECLICFLEIEPGDGVVLRECLHTFCR